MISIIEDDVNISSNAASDTTKIVVDQSGVTVDASCNTTITVTCLKQLYNAVGYVPSGDSKNSIGITGYLVSVISTELEFNSYLGWDRKILRISKICNHSLPTKCPPPSTLRLLSNLLLVSDEVILTPITHRCHF
jgi:hypothetical protein